MPGGIDDPLQNAPPERVALDSAAVAALDTGRRRDVRVEGCPGLVVRVNPTGHLSWAVVYRWQGQQRRHHLGPVAKGRKPARVWEEAQDILALVRTGVDPREARARAQRPARSGVLTVADVVRKALAALKIRPRTHYNWTRLAVTEVYDSPMGRTDAAALTPRDARRWIHEIADRRRYAGNHALALLGRAYSWAVERGLLDNNPWLGVRQPVATNRSTRVLSPDELYWLQASLRLFRRRARTISHGRHTALAFIAATELRLLTGAREGEIIAAPLSELSGLGTDHALLSVPGSRTKHKLDHLIPLSTAADRVVRRWLPNAQGRMLFSQWRNPNVPLKWDGTFTAALRQQMTTLAGHEIPPFTLHHLRHTFRTHAREVLKVPHDVAELILGHTVGSAIVRLYNRAELLDERREALNRWAEWLASLRRPRQALADRIRSPHSRAELDGRNHPTLGQT